ncbi:hypothetical protein Tco_1051707 [Tanacetum coccineum]
MLPVQPPGRTGSIKKKIGAHDKEGTRADVSAPGWSANDWLAPEGTKILPADQSEADTSAHFMGGEMKILKL